jgi:protein arginine N-methyltransferase 1
MSNIVKSAKKIVEDNKLSDKIEIIQGKVEEITLPVDKVRFLTEPTSYPGTYQ